MTHTPTSGAADLPDAIHMAELLENPINVVCQKTAAAVLRHQHSEFERLHELAAGQATAAQAVVQDDLITLRKPTTSAELLWLLKLAHLVISDVDKTLEKTFAPAQPAAQQGAAYAAPPDERAAFEAQFPVPGGVHWDGTEYVVKDSHVSSYHCYRFEGQWEAWKARASHGQAPAGATELAEADRRAGAAERKLAASKEDVARIERVRDKMKDQWGVDRRVSFDVVWAEALALKAGTKSDSGVQEDAAWMPLTPELLTAIESGDLGNRFWIAAHNNNEPQIGVYEWRQGRNPHGFNSDLSRYGASEITHVLPYKPPALPAARKQGENHDR